MLKEQLWNCVGLLAITMGVITVASCNGDIIDMIGRCILAGMFSLFAWECFTVLNKEDEAE